MSDTAPGPDLRINRFVTALDEHLGALAERDLFSGVALVRHGGTDLLHTAYGVATRRWHVPVTLDTRFDVASVTKLFTSVAVLQLVEAGRLDLDAPITGLVDLSDTTVRDDVTVRHLLTHTSGIADDADEEAGESYEELFVDRPNYGVTTTRDFFPGFAHKPPRVPPGTDVRYCNVAFVLAGLVVEELTGSTYRDHVREHVFARAGMDGAGFFHMRETTDGPPVAEGWDPVLDEDEAITGWRQNIYSYPPLGSPDGGAHCTAADLARFVEAIRNHELLGPELSASFCAPQVEHYEREDPTNVSMWMGFGTEVAVRADGSVASWAKDGINAGASAVVEHVPDADLTYALVSNLEDGVWSAWELARDTLDHARTPLA
ncbi:CubicO group peptidase (beta-lactamase class C family) [Nocardioides massiliensis]|uniref:CubicO group peptidase (Beta-lactamase class C family) n=3 Tax=Nocardioides massiliensis TaxID=1325935 RepID=A0ABT9NPN9_9ACTN|nr:serine hydrolase domain-containing protein [Nocardioides massiliensis]MDP9822397.1 CubicO group peptidase (beta-lactamase class C family) [Nocardioides massiliensis]